MARHLVCRAMSVVEQRVRIGVVGAGGKMGTAVCAAVVAAPGLDLVAAVDPFAAGQQRSGIAVSGGLEVFAAEGVDVVVDFTIASAARDTLPWLAERGIHAVVGTTQLEDQFEALRGAFTRSNCLVAANFAIGAVLMMRFAEMAAPLFETAEIIELHHDTKPDAPSGTALTTAHRMASASADWAADPTTHEVAAGARGGVGPAGIRLHSVRMRGMVAHQEVILGTAGQTLTIRHDSYDRDSFMPGVVLACRRIADHPGLTIGLDSFLGV